MMAPGGAGLLISIAACVAVSVGCGRIRPPTLGEVEGLIRLDGEPLADARVVFQPLPVGRASQGTTDTSGRYRLFYLRDRAGAIIGSHEVRIGRVPVLVGISDASLEESLALARCAAESGAAAVVAAPPYYFPAAQEPLVRWGRELACRVPLPLLLYNMPEMTKLVLEPDTVRRLADCPAIVGIKDSGGDLGYFATLARIVGEERPDWSLFVGPELLLPEACGLGGHGGIPGGANVMPRLFVDLLAAIRTGDEARVDAVRDRATLLGKLYEVGTMPGRIVVGLKSALAAMGICRDGVASSFERFDAGQRRQVADILASLDVTTVA